MFICCEASRLFLIVVNNLSFPELQHLFSHNFFFLIAYHPSFSSPLRVSFSEDKIVWLSCLFFFFLLFSFTYSPSASTSSNSVHLSIPSLIHTALPLLSLHQCLFRNTTLHQYFTITHSCPPRARPLPVPPSHGSSL